MENMAIVGDHDGHNGDASLDGKMKSTLLEGQQHGVFGIAASALGKHVDALLLGLNCLRGTLHGLARIFAVLAIDEDGTA